MLPFIRHQRRQWRRRAAVMLSLAIAFVTVALTAIASPDVEPSGYSAIQDIHGAMTPNGVQALHMRMTPERPSPTADEIAHTDQLADEIRAAIAPYTDISVAEADGYRPFPPDSDELTIVHYVHGWRSLLEHQRIDPTQPGSLLYERQPDGSLKLLGVMFTAPVDATEAELNQRVPLSITRWHLHTNICIPDPIWDADQWAQVQNGQPLFGPESPIATESACTAIGGEFLPTVFGWMVHANVYAENPADVWNPMYGAQS
ncbi:MAG: hypothetical protein AAF215_32650 [Cyanobacteria bacterium P01_A01_bin.123]